MMRNLYQHRRGPQLGFALGVAFLASVAVFGFDAVSGGVVRAYAHALASIAWNTSATIVTVLDRTGYFASRAALVAENTALKELIALYEEQSAGYRALEMQNEALQEIAQLSSAGESGITVNVLSSYRSSPYGTFVLAGGEAEGIAVGDLVLTPGGFVLGSVSDVDRYTATVNALFAPGNRIEVVAGDVAFEAVGRGAGNAIAEIPRGAHVFQGDAVLAPSAGSRMAGLIGEIESASSSATQTLYIRLPHNLDTLRFVYVVRAR